MTTLVQSLCRAGHTVDVLCADWIADLTLVNLPDVLVYHSSNLGQYQHLLTELVTSDKYDYVFPSWIDSTAQTVAELCKLHALPNITVETATQVKSKIAYYQIFDDLNIPYPKVYAHVLPDHGIDYPPVDIVYPCVAKPGAAVSKPGMKIFSNQDELVNFFSESNRKTDTQYCHFNEVYMIQQYIQGTGCCIMGHVHNNQVTVDFVYDMELDCYPYMAETAYKFPSQYQELLKQRTLPHIERFFQHIGLDNTVFMFDLVVDSNENFYFVDFGARMATNPNILVEHSGETNYASKLIDKLFSNKDFEMQTAKSVVLRHLGLETGILEDISCGAPELAEVLVLPTAVFTINRDSMVYKNGYAVVAGNTLEEAEEKFTQLKQEIYPTYRVKFVNRYAEIFYKKQKVQK
jgi:hypothetical protein